MDFEKGKIWQTPIQIIENDIDNNEFSINNYNNLSIFKQKFKETQFTMFGQKMISIMIKLFQLFKNKSVSRYGDKKNKKGKNFIQKSNKNHLFSPQHKIITSIKKKEYLDYSAQCELNKKQKTAKKEIDVYEDNKDIII